MCLERYREIEPEEQEFYKVMLPTLHTNGPARLGGRFHDTEYEIGVKYETKELSKEESKHMMELDYEPGFHGYRTKEHAQAVMVSECPTSGIVVKCKGTVRGLGQVCSRVPVGGSFAPVTCVVADDMTILEVIDHGENR